MSSCLEADIRRYQSRLIVAGRAVIGFGIWSVMKTVLFLYYGSPGAEEIEKLQGLSIAGKIFAYAFAAVMVAVNFLIHLYIGRTAMEVGAGKRKSKIYIVIAVFYIGLSLLSDILTLRDMGHSDTASSLTSIGIDLTACMAMADIVISSIKLKRTGSRLQKT